MYYVKTQKNAKHLALEERREAAETITENIYFFITKKRRKFEQKLKKNHFFTEISTILLRYG